MKFTRHILILITAFLLCAPSLRAQQDNSQPASMSELARNGVSLKTSIINPSSGVYAGISDIIRPEQFARVINNLQMTEKGIWTSRGIGYTLDSAQLQVGTVHALNYDSAIPEALLVHVKDKAYKYTTATQSIGAALDNSLFADSQSCIRNYDTGAIVTFYSQTKEPAYGNANTTFESTNWPPTVGGVSYTKPKFNEVFQGRVAYAGFAAQPNTVLLTNANAINSYTVNSPLEATDAGAITFPSTLGKITALRAFTNGIGSNDSVLLVGCERGVGLIAGTSALNYISVEVTREFGIPSNETFQELEGNLYFLATDGIRRMSVYGESRAFTSTLISQPVQTLVNRINKTAAEKAFAIKHSSTQEIQFWFPIDNDTQCQNCVILNYNSRNNGTGQESSLMPSFSTKNGLAASCAVSANGIMYGGDYSGYITKHYNGDTYNGSAINWQYVSPLIGANNPSQNASLKKFLIMTDGPAQKFTAAAYTLTTHADGTTRWVSQGTRSIDNPTQTITDITTWASGTTTTYPKFIDYAPMGSGRFWTLKLSGAATDEHISLVGVQAILHLGGLKQ